MWAVGVARGVGMGVVVGEVEGVGIGVGGLALSVLATFKVISGRLSTCDSAHTWSLYSAVSLGKQSTSTMT